MKSYRPYPDYQWDELNEKLLNISWLLLRPTEWKVIAHILTIIETNWLKNYCLYPDYHWDQLNEKLLPISWLSLRPTEWKVIAHILTITETNWMKSYCPYPDYHWDHFNEKLLPISWLSLRPTEWKVIAHILIIIEVNWMKSYCPYLDYRWNQLSEKLWPVSWHRLSCARWANWNGFFLSFNTCLSLRNFLSNWQPLAEVNIFSINLRILCLTIWEMFAGLFKLAFPSIFSGLAALMNAGLAREPRILGCSCLKNYYKFCLFPLLILF